jgi:hypothetical protein
MWTLDRRSLWLDEAVTARASSLDLAALLEYIRSFRDQTPFSYFISHLFYLAAGSPNLPYPEWLARLPEVLAGFLTIPLAWALARELLGTRAAWVNAVLWTAAPLAIAYSQEARPYAWLLLFTHLAALCLIIALRRSATWSWLGFALASAANFYDHYSSLIVLATHLAFAGLWLGIGFLQLRTRGFTFSNARPLLKSAVSLLLSLMLACLICLPWLRDLNRFLDYTKTRQFLGTAPSVRYFGNLTTWLVYDVTNEALLAVILIALTLVGVAWMARRAPMALVFCACGFLVPLTYLMLTQGMPVAYRYLIFLQVPTYLLLAAAGEALMERLSQRLTREAFPLWMQTVAPWIGGALIVAAMTPGLVRFYTAPYDDWRGAANYLRDHAQPGDMIIGLGGYSNFPVLTLSFYQPGSSDTLPVVDLNNVDGLIVKAARSRHGHAWGILFNEGEVESNQLALWGGEEFSPIYFNNVTLIAPNRARPAGNTAASAAQLITRYRALNPERSAAAVALLRPDLNGKTNLLANADFGDIEGEMPIWWTFTTSPGHVLNEAGTHVLVLDSDQISDQVNAIQKVRLESGRVYILSFECRNELSAGAQRIYVTFAMPNGNWVIFPNGMGYACPVNTGWQSSSISFETPTSKVANPEATIWLRNAGVGQVYFRNLSLIEVSK